MAIREFCDRCGVECTGKKTGALHGCDDADRDGGGTMGDHFDVLCMKCYKAWLEWMKGKPR
jgi:hypothetical protein